MWACLSGLLMTMLGNVDGTVADPAEQEVTGGGTQHDGQEQPDVVRHHD